MAPCCSRMRCAFRSAMGASCTCTQLSKTRCRSVPAAAAIASRHRSKASFRNSHQSSDIRTTGALPPRITAPFANNGSSMRLDRAMPPPISGCPSGGVISTETVATRNRAFFGATVEQPEKPKAKAPADVRVVPRNLRRVRASLISETPIPLWRSIPRRRAPRANCAPQLFVRAKRR
jgi:hypothetical protein